MHGPLNSLVALVCELPVAHCASKQHVQMFANTRLGGSVTVFGARDGLAHAASVGRDVAVYQREFEGSHNAGIVCLC